MHELTCIVNPNFSSQELDNFLQKIRDLANSLNGLISSESAPQKKRLAYFIKLSPANKREDFGYFVTFDLVIPLQNISSLDKELKLNKDVLRHLILNKEKELGIARPVIKEPIKPKKEPKVKIEELEKKIEEIIET